MLYYVSVSFRPLPIKPTSAPALRNQSANSYFSRRSSVTALSLQSIGTDTRISSSPSPIPIIDLPSPKIEQLEHNTELRMSTSDGIRKSEPLQNGWISDPPPTEST